MQCKSKTSIDMRRTILLLSVLALLSCSDSKQPQQSGTIQKLGQFYDSQEEETGEVWICLGKSSHAYHSSKDCYGIKACKGKIKKVSLSEAKSMKRTPCHYCHETASVTDEECEECEEDEYDPDRFDSGVYIINGDTIRQNEDSY